MVRKLSKSGLYISNTLYICRHTHKSRWPFTLLGEISPRTPCKTFLFCTVHRLLSPFFHAQTPFYLACIAVINSPKNAKFVPSESPKLGEHIHIHTIARNVEERPKKPKSPHLYRLKKRTQTGQGMTSSVIIASSVKSLHTVMQQSTD